MINYYYYKFTLNLNHLLYIVCNIIFDKYWVCKLTVIGQFDSNMYLKIGGILVTLVVL